MAALSSAPSPPISVPPPLGDDPLQLRAELGTALFSLLSLAQGMHLDTSALAELGRAIGEMRSPWVFAVVGEVKAGKSQFLNALFGRDVCRTDLLPATDRVHLFRHALEPRDAAADAPVAEHFRPINFLRDFHLADTPGMNSLDPGHNAAVEAFLPRADLVFFILPITNPWGAAPWEFLERIQRRGMQRVVLILQQSDLREDAEVATVLTHLRQVARQRLGSERPVFAVSAKKALLAKTTGHDKPRLWADSGFGPLEEWINRFLAADPQRIEKLHRAALSALLELRSLTERARSSHRLLADDRGRLISVAARMQELLAQQLHAIEGIHFDFDRALARCWQRGEQLLGERLRPWRALRASLGGDDRRWIERFRASLEPSLRAALTREVERALHRVQTEMLAARETLRGLVHQWATEAAAPGRDARADRASEDWLLQRRGRIRALDEDASRQLSGPALAKDLRDLFLEAAGELLTHGPRSSALPADSTEDLATSLSRRLTDLALDSAVAGMQEIPGGLGVGASLVRRARVLDAYHVAMSGRGAAIARSIRTLFERLIETYYTSLIRFTAPFEDFRLTEERRWRALMEQLGALEATLSRAAARLG